MLHVKTKWQRFKQVFSNRGGLKRSLISAGIVLREKGVRGLFKHAMLLKSELNSKNAMPQWKTDIDGKEIIPAVLKSQNVYPLSLNESETALPLVSIIVVNHNSRETLEELLCSINHQSYNNIETIVIDNASTDGSTEHINKNFSQVKALTPQQSQGFTKAVELAADSAQGRYFCLINNNMVLDKDAIYNLYQCLSSDKSIGAVAAKIRLYKKFITITLTVQKIRTKKNNKPSGKVFLDLDALRKSLKIYPKILFASELLNITYINDKECHEFEKAAEFKIPITHGQVRPVFRFYCDENNEITIKANGFEQTIEAKEKKWIEIRTDMLDSLKHSQWLISSSGDSGCGLYEQGPCGNALMVKPEVLTENTGYAISFCPKSIVYYK